MSLGKLAQSLEKCIVILVTTNVLMLGLPFSAKRNEDLNISTAVTTMLGFIFLILARPKIT